MYTDGSATRASIIVRQPPLQLKQPTSAAAECRAATELRSLIGPHAKLYLERG